MNRVLTAILMVSGLLVTAAFVAGLPWQETPKESTSSLRFEDCATAERFDGVPAPVQLRSAPYGRTFRTRLREGARGGPNFAGRFTLVMWGCGAPCQMVAVIDAESGRLSRQLLQTSNGLNIASTVVSSSLIRFDRVTQHDVRRAGHLLRTSGPARSSNPSAQQRTTIG